MNLQLLKEELAKAEFVGKPDAVCATLLNASTIPQTRLVNKVDTLNYLLKTNNIRTRLKDAAVNAAYPKVLRDRIDDFLLTVTNYEQTDYANFADSTANLVLAGILTQAEVDGFMALSVTHTSRAQQLLGEDVSESDVGHARNLDALDALQQLLERVDAAHGEVRALLQGAQAAMREGQGIIPPTQAEAITRFTETMETEMA